MFLDAMRSCGGPFLVELMSFSDSLLYRPASSFCPYCLIRPRAETAMACVTRRQRSGPSPVSVHLGTRTEPLSSGCLLLFPRMPVAVPIVPISCPTQSSATRLTSFAMTCRWCDPVSLGTAPELYLAGSDSQAPHVCFGVDRSLVLLTQTRTKCRRLAAYRSCSTVISNSRHMEMQAL